MDAYQQFIHISRYSRWRDDLGRRETWPETVQRYVDFFDKRTEYQFTDVLQGEVKNAILNAYMTKTGLSRNKLSKLMDDETWMDANKAVELGFADEIMQRVGSAEDMEPPAVSMLYSKANVVNSLMDKVAAKCAIKSEPTRKTKADDLMARLNLIKNWR